MLRRRILVSSTFGLATILLLLAAEAASAQTIRERLRNRFGNSPAPAPLMYEALAMPSAPATTVTQTSATQPATTVTTTTTTSTEPRRVGLLGRRVGNRVMMDESPATTERTRFLGRFGRRGTSIMSTTPTDTMMPDGTRRAFYPAESLGDLGNTALLTVRVPAQAEVLLGGEKTTSIGPIRRFVSPTLEPGSRYTYEIQAKWQEQGREITRTRKVEFLPGQRVPVNLLVRAPQDKDTP